MSGASYRDAGVDIDAGARAVELMRGAVEETHGPEVLAGVGAFGGLFDIGGLGVQKPVLVASTDGVGTKSMVASARGALRGLGHDLVNHCVDDILVQGARPLFFLDYVASSSLDPEQVAEVVRGCAEACKAVGCALLGGETAEMPGVYQPGELDIVGTIVGVVERDGIIDGAGIAPGDQVIGLASAGLHTNGFSLARRILQGCDLDERLVDGTRIADALLAPHRSYLSEITALQTGDKDHQPVPIKGLAHITGGGLIDNPPRILPPHTAMWLMGDRWDVLPIFTHLQQLGRVAAAEMNRVFNMGLGMLVVVADADVERTLEILDHVEFAQSWHVGSIAERGDGAPVVIAG